MTKPDRDPDFIYITGNQTHEFYLEEGVKCWDEDRLGIKEIDGKLYHTSRMNSPQWVAYVNEVQELYQLFIAERILLGE